MRDTTASTIPNQRSTRTCVKPLARGTCGQPVPDDAPIPLCLADLAKAWDYCRDRIHQARVEQAPEESAERAAKFFELMEQAAQQRKAFEEKAAEELQGVDDPNSVVYYVRFGDRIKIGFSRNLGVRLTVIPHDELLTVEPGARVIEKRRHQQFAKHRITGEWFAAVPELLEHIEGLKAKYAERDEWQKAAAAALGALDPHLSRRSDEEVLRSL